MSSALYRGSLVHTRRDHVQRTFRYPVFMAAIDLGDVDRLARELRLFSLDRPNLFSLYAKDYSTSTTRTDVSTTLVTNLRFAGYAFNPVSFFLRYAGDDLVGVTAEVNNTYGGRHCYVLDDTNRIGSSRTATEIAARTATEIAARTATDVAARTATDVAARTATDVDARTATDVAARTATDVAARTANPGRLGFRTTRELFVSPFLHGPRVYEWWFPARRDPAKLAITMHVDTPDGDRIFTSTLVGERRELTDRALVGAAMRYPINTAQVIGLIHYEAMKLRFLHAQPYRRPGPDHRPLDA